MGDDPIKMNPYAPPAKEAAGISTLELETKTKEVVRHADRAWLSVFGMVFLSVLGPPAFMLWFFFQAWQSERLIDVYQQANLSVPDELSNAQKRLQLAAITCAFLSLLIGAVYMTVLS